MNTNRDFTVDKSSQAIELIPELCSHYYDEPPCGNCHGECPLDVAINRLKEFRREYASRVQTGREAS